MDNKCVPLWLCSPLSKWYGLGSKPGLRSEKLATIRPNHGTAHPICEFVYCSDFRIGGKFLLVR